MAEVLPSKRVQTPPATEKVATFLSRLPNDWTIFVGWPDLGVAIPDFLVVSGQGSVALIAVSGASASVLDQWHPKQSPHDSAPMPLRRLHRAIRGLDASPFPSVPKYLILTNASDADVGFGFELALPASIQVRCLDTFTIEKCESAVLGAPPQPHLIDPIRAHIGKPSVVLPALTIQRPKDIREYRFLDSVQEEWLRKNLLPPDEISTELPEQTGAHLLTGVAGSGKSLLLLYRATLEQKLRPDVPILFVTHNRALIADLTTRAAALAQMLEARPVVIQQFLKWCRPWMKSWPTALAYQERENAIQAAINPAPGGLRFFSEEFAWIQDHGISSEAEYLTAERHGRKRPISGADRPRIWGLFLQYLAELERRRVTDFSGLTKRCMDAAIAGHCPKLSLIFVDEAQFFAPTALRTLRYALRDDGRIFFAADPTQGFLQRRTPWAACGLDMRGRSIRLKRPYRSTAPILRFARSFYLSRVLEPDPDLNLPTDEELATAPPGAEPEVTHVPNQQAEIPVARQAVCALIEGGVRPRHILVLHRNGYETDRIASAISAGQTWYAGPAHSVVSPNQVRVSSFDAATGLEAPYVVIIELRSLLEAERNPVLNDERDQLVLDNSRKIYMALTRSGYRLFVVWSGAGMAPPFESKAPA